MIGAVTVQITNGELDQVRPAALKRYISQEDWDSLSVSIYEVLSRGVEHNACMTYFRYVWLFAILASFGFIVFNPADGIFIYLALFCLISVLFTGSICYRQCVLRNSIEQDLMRFLAQYSRKKENGLTLHLLQDGSGAVRSLEEGTQGRTTMIPVDYVLQISVDQELGYREMNELTSPHIQGAEDERDEIKIRLEKLERAREHLSVEEYEEKRQEILSNI